MSVESKAKLNYLRMAPRKVRLVADLVRGMNVSEAETQLKFCKKKASKPLLELLNSAVANAENNFGLDKSNLYISKITVNEGPVMKRWKARAQGRADEIHKKTSHVFIGLDQIEKKTIEKKKKEEKGPEKKRVESREEIAEEEKEKEDRKRLDEEKSKDKGAKPREGKPLRRVFRRKSK